MADERGGSLRCPACVGTRLSDETSYNGQGHGARFRGWSLNFLGADKDLWVGAERARVCLDCGYLLLFAGMEKVETLRGGPQR